MRFARPALAVTAALSLTFLAGCAAAATPEEQAEAEFRSFVEATNGEGEINWCEDADSTNAGYDIGQWKVVDGEELKVEHWEEEDIYSVHAQMTWFGDSSRDFTDQGHSIQVRIADGEAPCVMRVYGFPA